MQKKIENWCKINIDKVLHFIVGLLTALLAFLWVWLIVIPIAGGIGKELYDKYKKKTKFDTLDILATWVGAVPVVIILILQGVFWK